MTSDTPVPRKGTPYPWSGRTWRALGLVLLAGALDLLPLGILGLPWVDSNADSPTHVATILAMVFIPMGIVVVLGPQLTVLRRAVVFEAMGVQIPPTPKTAWPRTGRRVRALLRSPRTWRQACYHLLAGPAVHLLGLIASVVWLGAIANAVGFAGYWVKSGGRPAWEGLVVVLCVVLAFVTPWVVTAAVDLDVRAATALLGPSRAEQLARRVANLTESRAAVVDAADAERRRIERDLHDGAQQRLVSLAMNLGLARATLTDLPEAADQALREAHEEAKEALTELRHLVRGLHPVVIEDRGLDAALSGIAARSPVPVRLTVRVPRRVGPTVEAVAYFTVSEALANIAKHARAAAAEVTVALEDDRLLRITVTDDGVGGAEAGRGTGLTGLAQRAASVDGGFRLTSPAGGPTTIEVDLPCAR